MPIFKTIRTTGFKYHGLSFGLISVKRGKKKNERGEWLLRSQINGGAFATTPCYSLKKELTAFDNDFIVQTQKRWTAFIHSLWSVLTAQWI